MPFKKNKDNFQTKLNKQKMDIKKKLMAITLKVDYYIYKNKPISTADATSYYHEVMSYQTLCKHDERSLQVIEKLSRFMVAIIGEQSSQLKNDETDSQIQYSDNNPVSPVYSMTEEDHKEFKLSCSQSNRKRVSFNESKCMTDVSEKNIQTGVGFKSCDYQHASVVGFDDNNRSDLHNNRDKNDSVEELVSLIDLTIKESQNITLSERETCSPSILNNIVCSETQYNQNLYADQCGQDTDEVDRVISDLLKGDKSKLAQENKGKSTNSKALAKESPTYQIQTLETLNMLNVQNKLPDTSTKRQVNKHGKRDPTKPAKQRKIENSIENIRKVKQGKEKTAHKKKNTAIVGRLNTILDNDTYDNTNIVYDNDLSWIENIKFVRQVNTEECEQNTLGEALWENCELPINWDDFI